MKHNLYVKSCNADVIYESDIDLKSFFEKNKQTLEFPGLYFADAKGDETPYKVIYNDTDVNEGITFDDYTCVINVPKEKLNQNSVVYMGYVMIERLRAINHSLTAHSACIDYNGNGILILGKEGSGKTTSAIRLCKDKGYGLVANDLSIIEYSNPKKPKVLEGTKYFFLRKESIKRNVPELLDRFGDDKVDSWLNKIKVMPEEIGIKTAVSTTLKRAFIVHIDDTQKDLSVANGNTMVNKLYLNENFQRYIRNACTTFFDKDYAMIGFVPCFDTEQFYKERAELIAHILEGLKLEYVSGPIDLVTEYIDSAIKNEKYNVIEDSKGIEK